MRYRGGTEGRGSASFAARYACFVLLVGCFGPLLAYYTPLPDASGVEGGLAVVGWIGVIALGARRPRALDGWLALLAGWMVASAAYNHVPVIAAVLEFSLYCGGFAMLRIAHVTNRADRHILRATFTTVAVAQVLMFLYQLVTYASVDSLAGTFIGTHFGSHIASFLVLARAGMFAIEHPRTWRGRVAMAGGFTLAYLADSKVSIVYFLLLGLLYLAVGRPLRQTNRVDYARRAVLLAVGVIGGWLFYIGALGNIPLVSYVNQSQQTGGGKIAVTNQIVDLHSEYWRLSGASPWFGAGPAQTVSRTAELTVPNVFGSAPAGSRLGIPQARWYPYFKDQALGHGYVSSSSSTSASSSLLGVMGDLGVIGLVVYGGVFLCAYRVIGKEAGYRSWPALALLVFLVPGFVGEWLEFPPSLMAIAFMSALGAMAGVRRPAPWPTAAEAFPVGAGPV